MTPIRWCCALVIGLGLIALVALGPGGTSGPREQRAGGTLERALGPLSSVAASVEWIRYRTALREGDPERAYGHAQRALELDRRSTAGWLTLADHLIFIRSSPAEVEDNAERRRWIVAGLDLLLRGEKEAAKPGELANAAGLVRATVLAQVPDANLGWPGGPAALLDQAEADFRRAVAHGYADGQVGLDYVASKRPR